MEQDLKNIRYSIYNILKPMRKKGCNRLIRLSIGTVLYNKLMHNGVNGRFKDASELSSTLNFPKKRYFQQTKCCVIKTIQMRVSKQRKIDGYISKPSVTIRYIFDFDYNSF